MIFAGGEKLLLGNPQLLGEFLTVQIMHYVFETHIHHSCRSVLQSLAVIIVIDGNKPYLQKRKYLFKIIADCDIVSAPTGEVLDNDAVYLSLFCKLKQFRHAGTVKVCPTSAVICKFNDFNCFARKLRTYCIVYQPSLIGYAVALLFFRRIKICVLKR